MEREGEGDREGREGEGEGERREGGGEGQTEGKSEGEGERASKRVQNKVYVEDGTNRLCSMGPGVWLNKIGNKSQEVKPGCIGL